MEENTGETFKRSKLKRLRRGREEDSPPAASSSKRRNAVLSDDDLDAEDLELPSRGGIQDIWAEDEDEDDDEDKDWNGARVFVATSSSGLDASTSRAAKEAIWAPFGQWVQERRQERAAAAAAAGD